MKLSREQIVKRAFQIFLTRGAEPGRELDDWYQAETELKKENSKKKKPVRLKK